MGMTATQAVDAEFTAFVATHAGSLRHVAWLLTGGRETAEDLVQDALLKTWLHWRRIDTPDDVAEALRLLRASPGMDEAKTTVARYAQQARDELAHLPDGPGREAMLALVDYTVNRHG